MTPARPRGMSGRAFRIDHVAVATTVLSLGAVPPAAGLGAVPPAAGLGNGHS
ncbi:hypothetical protein KOI35_25755 [Actinoplanes bogorensis]|uniref:Uncharacterized protein n=1 Tax=Paractinoplanes bogorensis TaxID=1610840 RepID=A0ABS5YTY6_9ACTN|nr:hypothetical protein [Actinoplanes bogorensis]MBU2666922.1 hypothetical protein [Actinoplanes bogorensis]